ncbi:MAG: ribonuclease III [Phormidesmis sp.]
MHKLLIFKDQMLRQIALTHRSYVNENAGNVRHNERLEFLGDAILTFISGEYLYQQQPELKEGEMTRRRSALVDKPQLARFAVEIKLDSEMRLGQGVTDQLGQQNLRLLSSTFEAVIGAYYLDNDRNIEILRPLVVELFDAVPQDIFVERSNKDSKTQLQELVQADNTLSLLAYVTERAGGDDHSPKFISRAYIDGQIYGEGKGGSKQAAEKASASDALSRLKQRI